MQNAARSIHDDEKQQLIKELQNDIWRLRHMRSLVEMSSFSMCDEEDDDQKSESSSPFFADGFTNDKLDDWERHQLDMIGEKLGCLLSDDAKDLKKIWGELMEGAGMDEGKFVIRLVCHDPSWVKRLAPILDQYTPKEIEKIFSHCVDGMDWPLATSRALCEIKLFKKYYASHVLSALVNFGKTTSHLPSHSWGDPIDVDDVLWLINISDAPAHVAWQVVATALQSPLDHRRSMAVELSSRLPKPSDIHQWMNISNVMFKPSRFALDWFDTWEQVIGTPSQPWRHHLLMEMFVLPDHWLNALMKEFCEHYPQFDLDNHASPVGSVGRWTEPDNEKYLQGIQKLLSRWLSDDTDRRSCLKLIAPHIAPQVFDVLLAPILSQEDVLFVLQSDISNEVHKLPNTQRHLLMSVVGGQGLSPTTSKM